MANKKTTIRLGDASQNDLEAIRAHLAARMPLATSISDVDVIRHALSETATRAREVQAAKVLHEAERATRSKASKPAKARRSR